MTLQTDSVWMPKSEYVSFDVFDTLIKRSVAIPTDLFQLIEHHFSNVAGSIPPGFAKKRREAELRANEKNAASASLDDIYNELRAEYGAITDKLKEFELRLEMDGCQPNPACVNLFYRCIEAGKTVVLISDMYLSSAFIAKMLDKCGIREYKRLFVSCEMGMQKVDGSLFRAVIEELQIHPKQLLHIGDSLKADLLRPLSLGIKTVHIDRDQKKLCKPPKGMLENALLSYRTLQACIRNCSQGMAPYEKMGCKVFGPQLYGFTQWLAMRLREDDIHDVYFMARDGYTMKQAFDELAVEDIRTHYLYCSRRAYQVPMIWRHSQFDDVLRFFSHSSRMTLRQFLLIIGLSAEDYVDKAKLQGLDLDRDYEKDSFYSDDKIRAFYNSIQKDVEENSKKEYDALVAYLHSTITTNRIAVVDIGFHGTMQYALKELFAFECWNIQVLGYYVAVAPDALSVKRGDILAKGYLHDLDSGADIAAKLDLCHPLFETQYLGPHGSIKRFEIENGVSRPVLFPYEYAQDDGQKIDEAAVIGEYQNGAIQFVHYMLNAMPISTLEVSPDVAIYQFFQLGNSPTLEETQLWGKIRFSNYGNTYMACPRSIWYYIVHWKALRKDFLDSGWRVGFMRRLFRIPFPYGKIVMILKKFYDRL